MKSSWRDWNRMRMFTLKVASLSVLHLGNIEASANFRAVYIAIEIDTLLVFGDSRFAVAGFLGENERDSLDFLAVRGAIIFDFRRRVFLFGFLVNKCSTQLWGVFVRR